MGDRTTVELTVLVAQQEAAKAFFDDHAIEVNSDKNITCFVFEGVNYGELDFLEDLQKHGIAYDSDWGSGGEYREGGEYCRFTEQGDVIIKTLYEDQDSTIPLQPLLDIINKNEPDAEEVPHRLGLYLELETNIRNHEEAVTVLPLDHQQIEYGKRYRCQLLIDPTKR